MHEPRNVSWHSSSLDYRYAAGIGAFIVGLSCAIATGYLKDNAS